MHQIASCVPRARSLTVAIVNDEVETVSLCVIPEEGTWTKTRGQRLRRTPGVSWPEKGRPSARYHKSELGVVGKLT